MDSSKKHIWIAALFFILGVIGSVALQNITRPVLDLQKADRSKEKYNYINPLLECNNVELSGAEYLVKLKQRVLGVVDQAKQQGKVQNISVYFRDLNNGPWFGEGEKELFSPASLLKLPTAIAYYKLAETDPSILQKKIKATESYDYATVQNITPEKRIEVGKEYTVEELIERSLVYSDNYAYIMLVKEVDVTYLYQVYEDLGIDISLLKENPTGNVVGVRNYSIFFRVLFNASYLSRQHSEYLLELMTKATFSDGLRAGVPKNIKIAHKYGERVFGDTEITQIHDCGIIYSDKVPYLLCVMTEGKRINELESVIQQISAETFNFLQNRKG